MDLKNVDKLYLNNLKGEIFDKDKFIDDNLLKKVCKISFYYNMEICLLIERTGRIFNVFTGNFNSVNLELPEYVGLNGIRIVHTHPKSKTILSQMDISVLKKSFFDCICAVAIDEQGEIGDAEVLFFDGINLDKYRIDNALYINKHGLIEKILENEKEYKLNLKRNDQIDNNVYAILAMAEFQKSFVNIEDSFEELENLAKTLNIKVVGKISQKRNTPDSKFMIGEGKIEELKKMIQLTNANLVIFENELNASKICNLGDELNVKVIDRSMLILDIFAKRAETNEGKLQVELAQLKYILPRIKAYGKSEGKFGSGGVGMRGPGETKLETNKRIIERNILIKSDELKKLNKHRELNRKNRLNKKSNIVAITGYTNSGKSTLLNTITKSNVYAKDELFATLDTTTRSLWLDYNQEILLTDTVGFINNLPHEFIEAFKSTLDECVYSDLILHVVDISNPHYKTQMEVTLDVLKKLGCTAPIITVFNKIDKIDNKSIKLNAEDIYISAKNNIGIDVLKERIKNHFFKK